MEEKFISHLHLDEKSMRGIQSAWTAFNQTYIFDNHNHIEFDDDGIFDYT
jgi:hypothetical protein